MKSIRLNIVLCLLILLSTNNASEDKRVFESWMVQKLQGLETAVQMAGCQRYMAHGYNYVNMYPIDGIAFDNVVVKKSRGELTYFEMHLAIKATKDGLILLSPTSKPGDEDLVYEIGVGISSNQFTILRLTKASKLNEVTRVNTQNILSTSRYTNLYIKISDDTLTFGREGDSPLISHYDPSLRTVKYFDMTSWADNDAKFLFDCPETSQIYCYYKSA